MGVEYSFSTVKKFKDLSIKDIMLIDSYLSWKNNPWNFEDNHYPTWELYWKAFVKNSDNEVFPGEPDKEAVEFYSKERDKYSVFKTVGFAKSLLRIFDDDISYLFKLEGPQEFETYFSLGKEEVAKLKEYAEDAYDTYAAKEVTITQSFKYCDEEQSGCDLMVSNCDGVFADDRKGNMFKICSEFDTVLYIRDEDCYYGSRLLLNIANILEFIDLDNYYIIYSRG